VPVDNMQHNEQAVDDATRTADNGASDKIQGGLGGR
jgi:hypothetical protein